MRHRISRPLQFVILLGISICSTTTVAQLEQQSGASPTYSVTIETVLNGIFEDVGAFDFAAAAAKTDTLTRAFPDFALGQLLHAELMSILALQPTMFDSEQSFSPRFLELLMEAQSRHRQSTVAVDNTRLPDSLLQIGNDIEHVIAVDLDFSRLYLVRNALNKARIVSHHYAASGRGGYGKSYEGDLRTPTGVYRVTEFKPDGALPELYGAGALTLNYPNALDRLYNRTGSGIWLHGIPRDDLSRSPRSSEGCVVMPNDLLINLYDTVDINSTLVVLNGEMGWKTRQELHAESLPFIKLFERWRSAWLNNDQTELAALHEQPLMQRAAVGFPSFASLFPASDGDVAKLATVLLDDLTIIRYPLFPNVQPKLLQSAPEKAQVMMQFAIPGSSHQRITLYWEQLSDSQWHIVQVKHDSRHI